jgi:hypothetical protein
LLERKRAEINKMVDTQPPPAKKQKIELKTKDLSNKEPSPDSDLIVKNFDISEESENEILDFDPEPSTPVVEPVMLLTLTSAEEKRTCDVCGKIYHNPGNMQNHKKMNILTALNFLSHTDESCKDKTRVCGYN